MRTFLGENHMAEVPMACFVFVAEKAFVKIKFMFAPQKFSSTKFLSSLDDATFEIPRQAQFEM